MISLRSIDSYAEYRGAGAHIGTIIDSESACNPFFDSLYSFVDSRLEACACEAPRSGFLS
jgi:hypothetical protein